MELVKLTDIHENQPTIKGKPIDPITFEPLNREASIRIDGNPPTTWLHYNPKTIKRLLTDTCMCGYPGINYVSDHLSGAISTLDLEEFKSALQEQYTHNVIHHLRHVEGDYIYKSPVTHTKYTEMDAERMFSIIEDREDRIYPHLRGRLKRTKKKKPKKTKQKKKSKKTKQKKKPKKTKQKKKPKKTKNKKKRTKKKCV
jgi:hypothetical protein